MKKAHIIAEVRFQLMSEFPDVLKNAKEHNQFLMEELKKDSRNFKIFPLYDKNYEKIGFSIDFGAITVNSNPFKIPEVLVPEIVDIKGEENVKFYIGCMERKAAFGDKKIKLFSHVAANQEPDDFYENSPVYFSEDIAFEITVFRVGLFRVNCYSIVLNEKKDGLKLAEHPVLFKEKRWDRYLANSKCEYRNTIERGLTLQGIKIPESVLVNV